METPRWRRCPCPHATLLFFLIPWQFRISDNCIPLDPNRDEGEDEDMPFICAGVRQALPRLLLLPLIWLIPRAAHGAEWLIICSGQSNMDGRIKGDELPEGMADIPANIKFYTMPGDKNGNAAKPQRQERLDTRDKWGPAVPTVHALAKARPGDTFVVFKYAVGGTALRRWVSDYTPVDSANDGTAAAEGSGGLYRNLQAGLAEVRAAHPQAQPLAVLWLQGESDSVFGASYRPNLERLVANFRRDTGAKDLLFVSADPAATSDRVYAALSELPSADPHARHITCRDLPHQDKQHYATAAVLEIGARYAQVVLEELAKSPPGDGKGYRSTDAKQKSP